MMILNPFIAGRVVRNDEFFGQSRVELSDRIVKSLENGENVIINGPYRYGKTSIMLRVEESLDNDLIQYCDCMVLPTLDDVKNYVHEALVYHKIKDLPVKTEGFDDYLAGLDDLLEKKHKRLYLLLDETSNLFYEDHEGFGKFTDTMQKLRNIHCVLIIHPNVYDNLSQIASDVLAHYRIYDLKPLSRKESDELFLSLSGDKLSWTEPILNKIYEVTNGVPFLLQYMGQTLFHEYYDDIKEGKRPEVSLASVDACAEEMDRHIIF